MTFLEELYERKLIHDLTDKEKIRNVLEKKQPVYLGIDPTAPSLHLGNYLGITLLKRFIHEGHKVIVVLGGMTGSIGDPSFRVDERVILSSEKIKENLKSIEREVKNFLPEAEIINNYSFYEQLSILNFVKEMCSCINVNHLLDKEFLKNRLNKGITLAEFVYPLFQSWDFLVLYSNNGVALQLGGSDQWGNITFGVDLIRKKRGPDHVACGMTFPLLTDNLGKKFGKSEGNALFLDKNLTSPYKIYQYLLNWDDESVDAPLLAFTFLDLEQIRCLRDPIKKKNILAFEICKDVYGINEAEKLKNISNKLFNSNLEEEDYQLLDGAIPTYVTNKSISYGEALKELKFVFSNSEINRLIESKGLFLFNELITDANQILEKENSCNGYYLIKKGKKTFGLVRFY